MDRGIITVGHIPYLIEGEIGHGLHSRVYQAVDLTTGHPVALKIVNFTSGINVVRAPTLSRKQSFFKELQTLLYLQQRNPYIIGLYNYEYDRRRGIIVMEIGGTFRDTLNQYERVGMPMEPLYVHHFWTQMVEAIYYMHRVGIVHGDCKPENFIQVGENGTELRLIDMGVSFRLPPHATSRLKTATGTPDYCCPEMLNCRNLWNPMSKCGYKSDVWALGVILFEMAFGFRPLQHLSCKEQKLACLSQMKKDIPIPGHPNPYLRDLLKRCLCVNPRKRISIEDIYQHPYFLGEY